MADGSTIALSTSTGYASAPTASNPADQQRWTDSTKRLNLLDGVWESDAKAVMGDYATTDRTDQWGPPNQSLNLYRSLIHQLACLYDEPPKVANPAFEADPEAEALIGRMNLWPRMQHHSRMVIGLRESAIRIEHTTEILEGINLRLVPANRIEVECSPSLPTRPLVIREARLRTLGDNPTWCWDRWDISDPEAPAYTIVTCDKGLNVTSLVLGDEVAAEPYRWVSPLDGRPYLPWVIYHAADKGEMWDHREWHELVYGTYILAMLWTFWLHGTKEASWEQKYIIDLMLQGLSTKGKDRSVRQRVTVDSNSLLAFQSRLDSDGRPMGGTVGSIAAGVDPERLARAILLYQQVVATQLGVSPADVQITSADAQSGIAISLSRQGIRTLQRRYMPQFKAADEELLQKIAWIHNTFGDPILPKLPNAGYTVTYPALPLSESEVQAILTRHKALSEAGVETAVDLLITLDPSLTRATAMERLRLIARERREIEAMGRGPVEAPPTDGTTPAPEAPEVPPPSEST